MIRSYSLLEFCTFTDFMICFFVLFLFCNCHCFAFVVRACMGVCYLTVFLGLFMWVGISSLQCYSVLSTIAQVLRK